MCWLQPEQLICVLSPCVRPFHDQPANALVPSSCSGNTPAYRSQKYWNDAFHQPVFRCLLLFAQTSVLPDNGDAHHPAGSPDRFSAAGLASVPVTVGLCFPAPHIAGDASRALWLWLGHGRDLPRSVDRLLLLAHDSPRSQYRLGSVSRRGFP